MTKISEMYEVAKTLKAGDVITYRLLMKRPATDKVESCLITNVSFDEERKQVSVTYIPCSRPDSVQCGFGCHFVREADCSANAAGKWGWQWIKKVGEERLPVRGPSWRPQPGNRGYDLMC